jgi:adenine-specific DNA-methyltransferase
MPEKLKMHTPDHTAQNIQKLAELFPDCVTEIRDTEGKVTQGIDFDQLRQELSGVLVEGPRERYSLDWPGKRQALLEANEAITKTLRPKGTQSVDFDSTRNIFIEGDNLDGLKLLQETYLGKVKLIYIDPPYNTGSDLIYKDSFTEDSNSYLLRSQQEDELGNRLVPNPATKGRFHSDWLSMIYPRLKLARNLLTDDGVILISIDDNELSNAERLCEEIFGEANWIATLVWEKGRKNDAKFFSAGHEYILVFAKSVLHLRQTKTVWREEKPGAREIWEKYVELNAAFNGARTNIELALQKWYSELPKNHPAKKWSRYKRVDNNGPWRDRDISWPGDGGKFYDLYHPITKKPCKVPGTGWRFEEDEMLRQIKLGLVEFREDHSEPPFRKAHIRPIAEELVDEEIDEDVEGTSEDEEFANQVRGTYLYKQSQVAVKYLRNLLKAKAFDNPKDHFELARLFDYVTNSDSNAIMLDFFAGSGSSAHAVMQLNRGDNGQRRFVVVQIPQPLDPSKKEQKSAALFCDSIKRPRTIAEITKERLRRAGLEVKNANGAIDTGFRVLEIDTSNMLDVYYAPDAIAQGDLLGQIDNIRPDRLPEDLLFQVLVDWGLDLALPIAEETIEAKQVFFVDQNALAACFDTGVTDEMVKAIALRKPLRAVFRDSSYGTDSVKINVEQIFKLLSPETEVRSI